MRALLFNFLFLLLPVVSFSQPQPAAGSANDTYYGYINGTATTLTLRRQGSTVSGVIDAGSYTYNISGSLVNNQLNGELTDPQTQAKMSCSGSIQHESVQLVLSDPANGQSMQFTFSKNRQENTSSNTGSTNDNIERDSNLVGNWLYSSSYTSGDYSFASQWRLIVNADGTYLYGDAKIAGGGPDTSATSEGGGYTRGQWKTQNKTIYINEGNGWQPYAGYYIEGNSMLLKFSDGSKQLWEKY